MTGTRAPTRRSFLKAAAALAAAPALPAPAIAQSAARVVVVGGGFGGAACARALKRGDPKLQVTLVTGAKTFVACPLSNEVIAGLREMAQQEFSYDRLATDGISIVPHMAKDVNASARTVTTGDGSSLPYDKLVLAPGVDLRLGEIDGYSEAAAERMPHAWIPGAQTMLLRRQLEAMDDGGLVVISVPTNPSRCPPAPYERASLIAHYLKTRKARSKVLILDAKDELPQQRLFEAAWRELYPDMIERVSLSQGGRVTSVDPKAMSVVTDFGDYKPKVANIIPPQKAGAIAAIAGVADRTGWCPIDPATLVSTLAPNIHVIGDACLGGGIPKSASAATTQGQACAQAIIALLAGRTPPTPHLSGTCYSTVAPDYAFSQAGEYRPEKDVFAEIEGTHATSPVDAPREVRARDADKARDWFRAITAETFG